MMGRQMCVKLPMATEMRTVPPSPLKKNFFMLQARFEEGYDIPDPKYEAWRRINHPNVVSSNLCVSILHTTPCSSSASFSSLSSSRQHNIMLSTPQASTKPNVPHKSTSATNTPCRSNKLSENARSPLFGHLNLPSAEGKACDLTSSECL